MKSLIESILDSDFDLKANEQAEKYVQRISNVRALEEFARNYFQKLYKEEFICIQKLRTQNAKNVTSRPGNPGREVLIKDEYQFDKCIKDYKTFKTKFLAFAKSLDKDLPHFIDIGYGDVGNIYVNDYLGDDEIFFLMSFCHIKPDDYYFSWKKSDPDKGGVKISLYSIDRCKLR